MYKIDTSFSKSKILILSRYTGSLNKLLQEVLCQRVHIYGWWGVAVVVVVVGVVVVVVVVEEVVS